MSNKDNKLRPAFEVAEAIARIAWVTRHGGLVDPECVEIMVGDRLHIANWLERRGFPGAAAELKREISIVDNQEQDMWTDMPSEAAIQAGLDRHTFVLKKGKK